MELKEFWEYTYKESPIKSFGLIEKMIQLESIENWLNAMYGIDLDIKVVNTEKKEGRFYSKGLVEKLLP